MMPLGWASSPVKAVCAAPAKAQRCKIELHAGSVEDAQHDALAEHGGHGGDAQVDLLAAHGGLDAAVLRQPPLGDVEVRHDLDARGHGGAHGERQRLDGRQDAVEPVADAHAVLARLDMDVGGLRFHGAGDELVHEANDRRFAGHVLQAPDVVLAGLLRQAPARLRPTRRRLGHKASRARVRCRPAAMMRCSTGRPSR